MKSMLYVMMILLGSEIISNANVTKGSNNHYIFTINVQLKRFISLWMHQGRSSHLKFSLVYKTSAGTEASLPIESHKPDLTKISTTL